MGGEKVRENRLRRMAKRQRLALQKSRRRDSRAHDYGRYWLLSSTDNTIAAGGASGLTLDEVEGFLSSGERSS
jgi:hypothetical protein